MNHFFHVEWRVRCRWIKEWTVVQNNTEVKLSGLNWKHWIKDSPKRNIINKIWPKIKPPLIQRKFIGILDDFIPIGIFPTKPFESKEWTLWNPMKFLWNASSHTSFGGILTRGRTSWKKSFWVFIFPQIFLFFLWSSVLHFYSYQNPMFFLFLRFFIPVIKKGPKILSLINTTNLYMSIHAIHSRLLLTLIQHMRTNPFRTKNEAVH